VKIGFREVNGGALVASITLKITDFMFEESTKKEPKRGGEGLQKGGPWHFVTGGRTARGEGDRFGCEWAPKKGGKEAS